MNPVKERSFPGDSEKKTKKESESDPAREKTNPGDPLKKYRNVKEELPNIGDPRPEKVDRLISKK